MEVLIFLGGIFIANLYRMESSAPKYKQKPKQQGLLESSYEDRIALAVSEENYEGAARLRDCMNGVLN